jgi:phosphoribosylformylglycinamidine synthase
VVTPDLKLAKQGGLLLHVDLAAGQRRLGGSALAQAYNQIGSDCPDVDPAMLKAMWNAVQAGVKQGMISAGHDISDGGIATTLLEMAFAGEERGGGGERRDSAARVDAAMSRDW